jgi:hypothetical protein
MLADALALLPEDSFSLEIAGDGRYRSRNRTAIFRGVEAMAM